MRNLFIVFLLVGIALLSACSGETTSTKHEASKANDSIIVRYQCPMKDQGDTTIAVAGACPKCGMDLEKVN